VGIQCASSIILKGENKVKIELNSYKVSDRSLLNAGLSHSDELMSSGAQAPDVMKIPFGCKECQVLPAGQALRRKGGLGLFKIEVLKI